MNSFLKLLGFPNSTLPEQASTWQQCFDPSSFAKLLNDARINGHLNHRELRLTRKDGGSIQVLASLDRVKDREKEYDIIEGILVELVENNDMGTMLNTTLNQLNAVLDAVPGIISWVSSDLKYLGINRQSELYAGINAANIVGRYVGVQDSQSEFVQFIRDFFSNSHLESRREVKCVVHGKCMDLLLVARKYNSNTAAVVVGIDITERKRSAEKIREQAALLDKTTDAILVQNSRNQIVYGNGGAEGLFDRTVSELSNKPFDELIYDEDLLEFGKAMAVLKNKGEWSGELRIQTPSGQVKITHSRWTLMNSQERMEKSTLTLFTDITEKKQLEQQLYRTQRMDSLGTLAGGIAHDLNNVLAPILMGSQILKMKFPEEDTQRMLDTIELSAKRGAQLVKQILTFARGIESTFNPIEAQFVINEVKGMIEDTFPQNIEFVIQVP